MSFLPGPPIPIPGMIPLPYGMPPPMIPAPYGMAPYMIPMGMVPVPMMGRVPMTMRPPMPIHPPSNMTVKKTDTHQAIHKQENQETPAITKGSSVNVFVGNINEGASDTLVSQILQTCGNVLNWKRVQGANGKPKGFGFCQFVEPEAALRAIRLLHDYELGNQKLVVKVDAKTKKKLEEYKVNECAKQDDDKELTVVEKAEGEEPDDTHDELTKEQDQSARDSLETLIKGHVNELFKSAEHQNSSSSAISQPENKVTEASSQKSKIEFERNKRNKRSGNKLEDMNLENGKRSLLDREIKKFRETYEFSERDKVSHGGKSRSSHRREYEFERESDRDRRYRDRIIDEDNSNRRRKSSRERFREREIEQIRSVTREEDWANEREHSMQGRKKETEYKKEEKKEAYECMQQDSKLKEKQAVDEERIRNWEAREQRKIKAHAKEKSKAGKQKRHQVKEAKKFKEFLEDYDDERDDPKYYEGSALLQRLKEREKEIEDDELDRQREREELDELRKKLVEEGHPDPDAKIIRFIEEESVLAEVSSKEETSDSEEDPQWAKSTSFTTHVEVKPLSLASLRIGDNPPQVASSVASQNNWSGVKRKSTVDEIFDANGKGETKRKKKQKSMLFDNSQNDSFKVPLDIAQMSIEGKRKHMKDLIDKIPTQKDELFAYTLDWTMVDKVFVEKRMRPWIIKKIIEYVGEDEPGLVEFICTKLVIRIDAQSILNDVSIVLDEEAEEFAVKLWRLLIYEIEAKKLELHAHL